MDIFRKTSRILADDFKSGKLSFKEYALLTYMLNGANDQGVIVTNSGILAMELGQKRKSISNLLTFLKDKGRIVNTLSTEVDRGDEIGRQRIGTTRAYPITLCDALRAVEVDRESKNGRQPATENQKTGSPSNTGDHPDPEDLDLDPKEKERKKEERKKEKKGDPKLLLIETIQSIFHLKDWQPERENELARINFILGFPQKDIDDALDTIVGTNKKFDTPFLFLCYLAGILRRRTEEGFADRGSAKRARERSSLTKDRQLLATAINQVVGAEICNHFQIKSHKAILDVLLKYDQKRVLAIAEKLKTVTVPDSSKLEWIKTQMIRENKDAT